MKVLAVLLVLAAPLLARAEEVWRWRDASGALWYTNRPDVAPPDAALVTTRLIVETDRLPGAPLDDVAVIPAHEHRREARPGPRRIYTEERLRFGCYASGILYWGGWSHAEDINTVGNCLPYLLGPEAWLNAARAELALRANGIDWRQVLHMYRADRALEIPRRVTAVGE